MKTTRATIASAPCRWLRHCALFIVSFSVAIGANAAALQWVPGASGNWSTPANWQGGVAPASVDSVTIGSGSATLDSSVATIATTNIGSSGNTATITIDSGGVWQAGADMATAAAFNVGNSGTGIIIIESGGILRNTGSAASNNSVLLGTGNAVSRGEIIVRSGGWWDGAGVSIGGIASSSGRLHIEAGGTVTLRGATTYVAATVDSYGEVIVDGFLRTGTGLVNSVVQTGAYYIPVGYTTGAVGVFTVNSSGTVEAGQLSLGLTADSSGTATIAGRYICSTGLTYVGNAGNGVLTIKDGGYYSNIAAANFIVASANTSWGLLHIEDGGRLVTTSNRFWVGSSGTGILIIDEGGSLTRYRPTTAGYDSFLIGGNLAATLTTTAPPRQAASGTVIVNGNLTANSFIHVGNGGSGYMYIGEHGTVLSNGLRLTYGSASSYAYFEVDGRYNSTTDNGHTGYIIVAHYGDSIMKVGQTGTVTTADYLSVGQGDGISNNQGAAAATPTGTLSVAGYVNLGTYLQVGNRLRATMDLTSTGTIIATSYFRLNTAAADASFSSTANIAGYLKIGTTAEIGYAAIGSAYFNVLDGGQFIVGTNLTNGSTPTSRGNIDIASHGTVTVGGAYSQGALSTLRVQLDPTRVPDVSFPQLTSPFIDATGRATLSGTLVVYGPGISEIRYTGNGEGKASELSGIPVLRAGGGISGEYAVAFINAPPVPADLPDFILRGGMKVNEGGPVDTRYDVGYGLAWKAAVNEAHGSFSVDSGKTFEVDVQLSDRPDITSGWDGRSLTVTGSNKGTLVLSIENNYTGATTVEAGTLRYEGPLRHTIGALTNNGVIDLGGSGLRTLRASTLAGSGTFRMTANLSTGASDRLIIDGDATGHHHLFITGIGDMPSGNEPNVTLVSIGGVNDITYGANVEIPGGATFGGEFDYGLFHYSVDMLGHNIVIVNTGLQPASFDAIRGVPGAQSVLWFDQQDNLGRRLGEMRAIRETASGFDLWARGHAASATIGDKDNDGPTGMRRSNVDLWGVETGVDYTWKLTADRITLGAFLGYGDASQKFDAILIPTAVAAKGKSELLSLGLYAAWQADAGFFANATLTASRYKNSFDATDQSYNHTTANYNDAGYGGMVELGYRFDVAAGWFVEPSLQAAASRISRIDYTAYGAGDDTLSVQCTDTTLSRLRGVVRAGRSWETGGFGWLEVAARVSSSRVRSSGGEVTISNADRWRPNVDGNRYEAGASVYWRPKGYSGQLYFDYEYATGDNYRKPWSLSLGVRISL